MSSDNNNIGIYDDVNNRWRQYWDADDYDLYHQNGERILRADENGGTSIYHNNTARLTTTSA